MKMLILTSGVKANVPERITQEAQENNWIVTCRDYSDLYFEFGDGLKISDTISGFNLLDFDVYILRGVGALRTDFFTQRSIIAKYLLKAKKRVLNGNYYADFAGGSDKLLQHYHLAINKLPVVNTLVYGRREEIRQANKKYPYVLKVKNSSRGRGVEKIEKTEDLNNALKNYKARNVLVQDFVEVPEDYRVIVLGQEILGVMKRVAPKGDFKTNIAQGGEGINHPVTDKIKSISKKVSKVFDLEFAGVDLVKNKKDEWFVYEVNDAPEFKGFESSVNVDVAKKLVSYLGS